MKKLYYSCILTSDFLILGFYFLIFIFLLIFSMQLFKLQDRKSKLIILGFFALYNALIYLDFKLNFIPYLPDSGQYNILFKTGRPFVDMSKSLNGFLYVIKGLRVLFVKNILVYISFQIFLYFISVIIFYRSWFVLYQATRPKAFEQLYFLLALSLPSAFLYHLVPLRECFTTLGFSIALYFLLKAFKNRANFNLGFVSGLFIIIMTRIQMAFYFIVGLMGLKFSLDKSVLRKVSGLLFGLFLFAGVLSLTHYKISPEQLSSVRNYRVAKYSGSYGKVAWSSYTDIVKSSPQLVGQFLFSPLPILHNQNALDMKLIFLDALFMFVIWLVILINAKKWVLNYRVWFLLMLIYLALFGIYEFNIGGAVRHRLPLSLMAILMASQFLSQGIYSFNSKMNG